MASTHHNNTNTVPQDTLITIKITIDGGLKKLKLPLRDLTAATLPDKLRHCLNIKPEHTVVFERFSDSAGGYITLDPNNPQVFKTLIRAAKAKLKLRLKATITPDPTQTQDQVQTPAEHTPPQDETPTIVSTPIYQVAPRNSVAMDRRSVGHNIFKFREARASQQTLVDDEAPLPKPFTASQTDLFDGLARAATEHTLPLRSRETVCQTVGLSAPPQHTWTVYCNECDVATGDTHFHCSICDGGDYDLCEKCVADGKLCRGDDHWLVKRFIRDGKVVNSTTTTVERKRPERSTTEEEKEVSREIPGAFQDEIKTLAEDTREPTRTCNCCVIVLPEHSFVTCSDCEDYDLCITCFTSSKHGHHPGHAFGPATEKTVLPAATSAMLSSGRGVRHHAICDGCDKIILGVRHKCLSCPDWDYCNDCIKNVKTSHPRHRFAALFAPLPDNYSSPQRHYGIYCDGPLCSGAQSYIRGVRYKCAVCHDTDFCDRCEALPTTHHNRTHPLIKFKTPVRNASIQTSCEDAQGSMRTLGDQSTGSTNNEASADRKSTVAACIATPVQTMADFQPSEASQPDRAVTSDTTVAAGASPAQKTDVPPTLLNAYFVRDIIPDGMSVPPNARFIQIWTLKNPGPYVWPAGCSVRYVGGDNMLNIDNNRIASAAEIAQATESNVVGRDVGVNEEVAFKVVLKSPTREGKSISYWRLKAADGTPFGHRLWCDVNVKPMSEPPQSEASTSPYLPPSCPETMAGLAEAMRCQMQTQDQQMIQMQQQQQQQQQMQQQQQQQQQQMQQQQMLQHQMMLRRQREAIERQQVAPPSSSACYTHPDIASRVAHMRQAQQARREQLMAQFNAQREQPNGPGVRAEEVKPYFAPVPVPRAVAASPDSVLVNNGDAGNSRKEAAKFRVEAIKAKILKARELRAKFVEAEEKLAANEAMEAAKPNPASAEPAAASDIPVKLEELSDETEIERSQMVFPKLEKESPASSTYASAPTSANASVGMAAYVETEDGEIEQRSDRTSGVPEAEISPTSPANEKDDFEDLADDLESLSAEEDVSESDGFMTDEEYDILDASDRETVASH